MPIANSLERQMLALINFERTSRGLNPVQLELRLNGSAETHSQWMLQTDVFSHTGAGGSSADGRMRAAGFTFSGSWAAGENIALQSQRGAAGFGDDVIDLHNSLMNSAGHRANILNPTFTLVGIGIETGTYDGFAAVVVTQNFAHTGAAVQLDTGPTTPDTSLPTLGNDILSLVSAGTLSGLAGHDRLTGSAGDDALLGGKGSDTIAGGEGNDTIVGGKGVDYLQGDAGNDLLIGAKGNDVFIFGSGQDIVQDFKELIAAEDIDMRQASGVADYNDLFANHMVQQGANVLITDELGNSMLVLNALLVDMDASNFLF